MDQRKAFLDAASEGFKFTRGYIEMFAVEPIESEDYEKFSPIQQSAGWYRIWREDNVVYAWALIRGERPGLGTRREYSWEVPE